MLDTNVNRMSVAQEARVMVPLTGAARNRTTGAEASAVVTVLTGARSRAMPSVPVSGGAALVALMSNGMSTVVGLPPEGVALVTS